LFKTCDLILEHVDEPSTESKMGNILFAWRKYAYLKRNEKDFVEMFRKRARHTLKAKFLTAWY
jgi:hypothetical protein